VALLAAGRGRGERGDWAAVGNRRGPVRSQGTEGLAAPPFTSDGSSTAMISSGNDPVGNWTEICAYGTAVVIEPAA